MSRRIVEEPGSGPVPLWLHPEWTERFPWLLQGTTGRGVGEEYDLGLFGPAPGGVVLNRWSEVRGASGMAVAIHSRQVHGTEVACWRTRPPKGLLLVEGFDAHVTDVPGVLLSVSVADCVPLFLVDEARRTVALVHAGWRGVAAGILEGAIEALQANFGSLPAALWLHCGPSICGRCYEVGPEVHLGVRPDRTPPSEPTPIDLRETLVERAVACGVDAARVTISAHCSRCGPGDFFSHRGGSPARQMGLLGVRG